MDRCHTVSGKDEEVLVTFLSGVNQVCTPAKSWKYSDPFESGVPHLPLPLHDLLFDPGGPRKPIQSSSGGISYETIAMMYEIDHEIIPRITTSSWILASVGEQDTPPLSLAWLVTFSCSIAYGWSRSPVASRISSLYFFRPFCLLWRCCGLAVLAWQGTGGFYTTWM